MRRGKTPGTIIKKNKVHWVWFLHKQRKPSHAARGKSAKKLQIRNGSIMCKQSRCHRGPAPDTPVLAVETPLPTRPFATDENMCFSTLNNVKMKW